MRVLAWVFIFCLVGFSACDFSPSAPVGSGESANHSAPSLSVMPGEDIQAAIEALPESGGTVRIASGVHVLESGIHIKRSNVSLVGEAGAVLKLGDQVRQPVILVGSDKSYVTEADSIYNISIMNLELDGNRDNQTGNWAEFDPSRTSVPGEHGPKTCWIRNNTIDVRVTTNLRIENVDAHDARSGGLVVSWLSKNIHVTNSSFNHNFFDGIALYDSENILISNFFCSDNHHAGLSLDNKIKDVSFSNGHIKRNGGVGLFARDCSDIGFHNVVFAENMEDGAFISYAKEKEDLFLDGQETAWLKEKMLGSSEGEVDATKTWLEGLEKDWREARDKKLDEVKEEELQPLIDSEASDWKKDLKAAWAKKLALARTDAQEETPSAEKIAELEKSVIEGLEREWAGAEKEEINTGIYRLFFSGCSFLDNNRMGLWLAAPAKRAHGNACVGSLFAGNKEEAINEAEPGTLLGAETNAIAPERP